LTLRKDADSTTARYVAESNKTAEKWKFSTNGWLTSTTDRNDVGETYASTRTSDGSATGTRGSSVSYYVNDHLGSIIGIFNNAGAY